MKNEEDHEQVLIVPRTRKELAAMYAVSVRTLNRWLRPHREKIGSIHGKIYTPLQVKNIYGCIGLPCSVAEEC